MSKVLTFLMIVAIIGAPTLRLAGQAANDGRESNATLLEHLKPGQAVSAKEDGGRYDITVWPENIRPLSHHVVEVGPDYIAVRDNAQVSEVFIPIYSIKVVRLSTK